MESNLSFLHKAFNFSFLAFAFYIFCDYDIIEIVFANIVFFLSDQQTLVKDYIFYDKREKCLVYLYFSFLAHDNWCNLKAIKAAETLNPSKFLEPLSQYQPPENVPIVSGNIGIQS